MDTEKSFEIIGILLPRLLFVCFSFNLCIFASRLDISYICKSLAYRIEELVEFRYFSGNFFFIENSII